MMKHRLPMGACVAFVACAVFLVGCGKEAEERAARAEAEARALQAERQALTERNEQLDRDIEAVQAERDALKARLASAEPAKHLPQQAAPPPAPTERPKPAGGEAGALAADRQGVAEARQRLDDLGAVLFERGELNIALAVSQSAFELGADSPQVLYRIAYCKAAAGQYESAAEWYERVLAALGAGPGKDDELVKKCLNNYGVTQQRLGKPGKAAELYQRALALDQAYAPAYFNLGLIYANELNRPADAVEAFRKHVIYGGTRSVTARAMIQKLLPRTEAATPAE
jgi:tetratricopeptide (TPR) repeat protein